MRPFLVLLLATPVLAQTDCNQNGIPDDQDIALGHSNDCNGNGIPDECEFGQRIAYLDFDAPPVLPAGNVTVSMSGLWHVTTACRPPGGGGSGSYAYFGIDTQCNFDANAGPFGPFGFLVLQQFPVPAASIVTLQYWSYYEGEGGGNVNCDPTANFDSATVRVGQDIVDDHCDDPVAPVEWKFRTVDLSPYAGQTVAISWQFHANDGFANGGFGWGVDDIRVTVFEDVSGNGVPDLCERISVTYCSSNPSSTGAVAGLAALGSPFVADEDLFLRTVLVPRNVFGYYLTSMVQGSSPLPPPSSGNLCLGLPIVRFSANVLSSGAIGELRMRLDFQNLPQGAVFLPGQTWNFQSWFRDGATSNTSRGVEVAFQ